MMSSFESMKAKLESTGIYSVTEASNISKELKAYAEGLDILFDELEIMERECFIETAESYGLSERERFVGVDRSGEALEKRRELLETAEQIRGDCKVASFEKIMHGYGVENFSFSEHPTGNYIIIYIYDDFTLEQQAVIRNRAKEDFPAHLDVTIYFK